MTKEEFVPLAKTVNGLLRNESRWTKYYFAKNKQGYNVFSTDKDAVKFCLIGAVNHIYSTNTKKRLRAIYKLTTILKQEGHTAIARFNDDPKTTFEDVKKLIKKARI